MKIHEITKYLESLAPLSTQESYDNCGLILGDLNADVDEVLISLDCTEEIVDEAIEKGISLIISHHPIVFKGLKKLNGSNYIERTIIKAIKNDIAIYALHTNFDNYLGGVNLEIGERIGLNDLKILLPKSQTLKKISCYVPVESVSDVKNSLFASGAGELGEYSNCSFVSEGVGGFLPSNNSNPVKGVKNELFESSELKLEVIVSADKVNKAVAEMIQAHPYEEPAYEVYTLDNTNNYLGSGMVGVLQQEMSELDFLAHIKEVFECGVIRHTKLLNRKIKKVAFCGGAGGFLLNRAKSVDADIFITGDYKYHEFFDSENQIVIADIGHFESEQFTSKRIGAVLMKKFPNFAIHLTEVNTNPINYF